MAEIKRAYLKRVRLRHEIFTCLWKATFKRCGIVGLEWLQRLGVSMIHVFCTMPVTVSCPALPNH